MTVLIPAYEPDERMIGLLERLRNACSYRILIVDDGSGFQYRALFDKARDMGCIVLIQEKNQGKGAALKHGFAWLSGESDDGTGPRETEGVVCADCDGQHIVEDILRIAREALEHPGVMVLGKRDFSAAAAAGVPARSMLGNTITRLSFAAVVGQRVYDVNTGLRAYSADMLDSLRRIRGDRFEYEMNLLTQCRRYGFGVLEIPIQTVYEQQHTSHFRTVADTLRVSAALLLFGLSSLAAFAIDYALYFLILSRHGSGPYAPSALAEAIIGARAVSAVVNYLLNRYVVFGQGDAGSAPKYFALALVMLGANYVSQHIFTQSLGWMNLPAKLLTDVMLFAVSFFIQRIFVFRGRKTA